MVQLHVGRIGTACAVGLGPAEEFSLLLAQQRRPLAAERGVEAADRIDQCAPDRHVGAEWNPLPLFNTNGDGP